MEQSHVITGAGIKDLQRSKARSVIANQDYLHLHSMSLVQKMQSKMENSCVPGSAVNISAVFHGLGNV